jgi:PAS domain S-box-containing protein
MIISSEDGKISLVNSQVEVIFGFHRQELINRNIRHLVPEWHGLAASAGLHKDLSARRKDGTEFPAEISLSPLQTVEGLLVTSAIRDITERKKAEIEIRELNAGLEQRVAERTQELLESNEALRQSNDDLNQFAYAASHDLQEPLRMISLYSQFVEKQYGSVLDEKAHQYLSLIVTGAQRMELLLRDLLAYSQTGVLSEGRPGLVDCAEVMEKVLLNLRASIEENDASVTFDNLPTVQAHEIQLVQLLQNLVGNGIKYRRADPPQIHITARRRDSDWLFSVRDNGIGIEPEYAQQVFGIFKRLHGNTYPGTGIGLAICQRIVERNGGRIWVESTLGEGSLFCFTLPLASVRR